MTIAPPFGTRVGEINGFPVIVDPDCPFNAIYFLPHGSKARDQVTGQTVELAPGYYVNPDQCGVIKNGTSA